MELQAKLLRVLQDQAFRLGGTPSVHLDLRVISATNRNLEEMVEQGGIPRPIFITGSRYSRFSFLR